MQHIFTVLVWREKGNNVICEKHFIVSIVSHCLTCEPLTTFIAVIFFSYFPLKITNTGFIISDTVVTRPAIFINFNTLICNTTGDISYNIAVSSNGVNTSQPISFYIYNSNCVICDAASDFCIFEVTVLKRKAISVISNIIVKCSTLYWDIQFFKWRRLILFLRICKNRLLN